jgi:hypothetical protein
MAILYTIYFTFYFSFAGSSYVWTGHRFVLMCRQFVLADAKLVPAGHHMVWPVLMSLFPCFFLVDWVILGRLWTYSTALKLIAMLDSSLIRFMTWVVTFIIKWNSSCPTDGNYLCSWHHMVFVCWLFHYNFTELSSSSSFCTSSLHELK